MQAKRLFQDKILLFLLLRALLIHFFSLREDWVERYYTYGFYPKLAQVLRALFGWLPFSLGDVVYFLAGLYLLIRLVRFIKKIRHREQRLEAVRRGLRQVLKAVLFLYCLFNLSWGLNYNRLGIAHQWGLAARAYSTGEVEQLTAALHARLNEQAGRVDAAQRRFLSSHRAIYEKGYKTFREAARRYPFLAYRPASIKSSLYSFIGQYVGFTGYFNPFTHEAQLKTSIPEALKPFIVHHEIGHQVGYGKENEANFISYIVGKNASDPVVRYSTYFETYLYAVRDLGRRDSTLARHFQETLHPQVKTDIEALILYYKSSENKLEPYFNRFYDQFLKLNKQPKGTRTYNEVVAWLVAYQKKYGTPAI